MSPEPPHRLARAMVFTTVCVALTMFAHVATSRTAVPPVATGAGGAAVLGMAWLLAGHPRSLVTILAGLLGGQFALHVLFAAFQSDPDHLTHGQVVAAPVGSGTAMTLAHLAAAAISAWWLWRGERLAWQLARRLAELAALSLTRLLAQAAPAPAAEFGWAPPPQPPQPSPASLLLRHTLVLRGPPPRSPLPSTL